MPAMERRRLVVTLLVALLLAGCAGTWWVGGELVEPVRFRGPPPAGLAVEEVRFAGPSGTLEGWLAGPADAGRAALLMHGVRGNRRQMLGRARFLVDAGFAVLLFDFQSHGASDGEAITFGHREAGDARAALAFLRERCPEARVAAIGWSLGGAAALLGDAPLDVEALVLEAVFPTLDEAIDNRLRHRLGAPGAWLRPLLTLQLRPRLGFGVDDLRPIDRAPRVRVPTLVVAGTEDRRTTPDETRRLHDALGGEKDLWMVEGAGHVDLFGFAPEAYRERVLAFLGE